MIEDNREPSSAQKTLAGYCPARSLASVADHTLPKLVCKTGKSLFRAWCKNCQKAVTGEKDVEYEARLKRICCDVSAAGHNKVDFLGATELPQSLALRNTMKSEMTASKSSLTLSFDATHNSIKGKEYKPNGLFYNESEWAELRPPHSTFEIDTNSHKVACGVSFLLEHRRDEIVVEV